MHFNTIVFAVLASVSMTMSATVTVFQGADCTGATGGTFNVPANECLTFGAGSAKSISYSGVPSRIQFFESGGAHDACTNGSQLTRGGGSGCATAPAGFNWESLSVN